MITKNKHVIVTVQVLLFVACLALLFFLHL